jgi:hypothetical protein
MPWQHGIMPSRQRRLSYMNLTAKIILVIAALFALAVGVISSRRG